MQCTRHIATKHRTSDHLNERCKATAVHAPLRRTRAVLSRRCNRRSAVKNHPRFLPRSFRTALIVTPSLSRAPTLVRSKTAIEHRRTRLKDGKKGNSAPTRQQVNLPAVSGKKASAQKGSCVSGASPTVTLWEAAAGRYESDFSLPKDSYRMPGQ